MNWWKTNFQNIIEEINKVKIASVWVSGSLKTLKYFLILQKNDIRCCENDSMSFLSTKYSAQVCSLLLFLNRFISFTNYWNTPLHCRLSSFQKKFFDGKFQNFVRNCFLWDVVHQLRNSLPKMHDTIHIGNN
jgi:hypothetical protein